jgi:hypothetical protein
LIYRFIYFWKDYAYPSYNIPREQYCFGEHSNWATGGCYESDKQPFIDTISIEERLIIPLSLLAISNA